MDVGNVNVSSSEADTTCIRCNPESLPEPRTEQTRKGTSHGPQNISDYITDTSKAAADILREEELDVTRYSHDSIVKEDRGRASDHGNHDHEIGDKQIDEPEALSGSHKKCFSHLVVFHRHRRHLVRLFWLLLFTGWWIASLILHYKDKNWVLPFLLWLAVTIRIATFYVTSHYVAKAAQTAWRLTAVACYNRIPPKFRNPAGASVTISVMLVGSFVSPATDGSTRSDRAVSLLGLGVIVGAFWLTSRHRSRINWRTVIGGMLAQYIIGLFVLRTRPGYSIFKFIADRAGDLLGFAGQGVSFLTDENTSKLPWFFIGVVPAIIFFISIVQVLYYYGIVQWFIKKLAIFVYWALGVSGAEAVVAVATPFVGQGESAMLVQPFVPHMTNAEIHQVLTCGFATISGSVLVGYIQLGLNAEAMVSSCIMSIPASLAISKLRYPETEGTFTAGRVVIPNDEQKPQNVLHAFTNGTWIGIKIGGTIIASLLCTIAFVGLINGLLTWWGHYLDINDPELTLQTILGYVMLPVAFLIGVPREKLQLLTVSRLIAQKIITNEYNGFHELSTVSYKVLYPRSQLIATYALCGFGNLGSLGVQIGILSQIAPSRGGDVSGLAISALISGIMSTLTSASIAGLVVTNQLSSFVTD
ncbi:hypothetical protein NQ176_g2941 [Zarea fungicola]|uniref:Uncharacterized protein n=1 Tax=Zarea fungicola TaxID=93591 RepID=A0ACC1NLJ6_9HYPO|nr:hypothetical protein NQ176_g2941 [Lecanicillium fungicola]